MVRYLWALVALAFVAGPTLAADPQGEPASPPPSAELRLILRKFEDFERTLAKYDESHTRLVEHTAAAIAKDIGELRELFRLLREDVDRLKSTRTESRREPTSGMGQATVVLENQNSYYPMETVINGATYVVLPGNSKSLTVTAGRVDIQVMQTDAAVRVRTVQPGEIKTVTMR